MKNRRKQTLKTIEGGTCYDENGNCYGCGAHIHDVTNESVAE